MTWIYPNPSRKKPQSSTNIAQIMQTICVGIRGYDCLSSPQFIPAKKAPESSIAKTFPFGCHQIAML